MRNRGEFFPCDCAPITSLYSCCFFAEKRPPCGGHWKNWSQQVYLKASNTETLDNFGEALGISGDTIAVGAFWETAMRRERTATSSATWRPIAVPLASGVL
jgi:hypothetical protein